jgi:hypothetical protein
MPDDAAYRNATHERDGGWCVAQVPGVCRRSRQAETVHHRVHHNHADMRPQVLLSVCGDGVLGCHGWIERHPAQAAARGWTVRRAGHTLPVDYPAGADPATVPVWYAAGPFGAGWYYLDHLNGFAGWPTSVAVQGIRELWRPPAALPGEEQPPWPPWPTTATDR